MVIFHSYVSLPEGNPIHSTNHQLRFAKVGLLQKQLADDLCGLPTWECHETFPDVDSSAWIATGNLAVSYGNHNEHTEHIGLSIATLNYQGVYSSRNQFHPCPKYKDGPVNVSIGCRSPSIISNQLYFHTFFYADGCEVNGAMFQNRSTTGKMALGKVIS